MSFVNRTNSREDHLNDSWVELNFHRSQRSSISQSPATTPPLLAGVSMTQPHYMQGHMEKLLLEAQRESRGSSIASSVHPSNNSTNSSRASPKSPHSPNNERNEHGHGHGPSVAETVRTQDWIWDWSSRPEVVPPSDSGNAHKYKHPSRAPLSVRNTVVMRKGGVFCMENLPTLLFSHACSFFIGAAVMFLYLKKYCRLSSSSIAVLPVE